jgi:hypothetical protein
MKNNILTLALSIFAFVFFTINATAQKQQTKIEIIQFHSEHRCMTCNKIEKLTRETLKDFPSVPFSLVNVDDVKNEKKATQFEATGTALFLYNPKTGKKKNLTDFAFMNAGNEAKFQKELTKEIQLFLKS